MAKAYNLLEMEDDIIQCMKCGNCQATCPIYLETHVEGDVARGKIQLAAAILKGQLPYSKSLEKRLGNCLLCKACTATCPCGVDCAKIILAARQALAANRGLPVIKRAIFQLVKYGKVFNSSMRIGAAFAPIAIDKNGKLRFPIGLNRRKVYPNLKVGTFRSQLKEFNPAPEATKQKLQAKNKKLYKVALFTGCSMNHIYPQVGKAIADVLHANGVDIIIPQNQQCCGAAVYIHGDRKSAKSIARDNTKEMLNTIEKYQGVDALITACGTCGSHWQKYMLEMLDGDPLIEKLEEISKKTYDITTFITKVVGLDKEMLGEVKRTITYHDPCHLIRGMNVHAEPREILNAIPGLELKEMKLANSCCGGAGSFSLTHFDLSMDIHKHKNAAVKAAEVDAVVTGCGSCMMQFADGNNQAGTNYPTLHTLELLAESYRNKAEKSI